MSGAYWDFRSCCWQGQVELAPPDWPAAVVQPASVGDAVPEQATAAEVEQLPSPATSA